MHAMEVAVGDYPNSPGHRGVDTSLDAARSIELSVGHLQRVALRAIQAAGPRGLTTNELVAAVQIHRDSLQPRTTELCRKGLIRDSGARRRNANGKYAIVWVAETSARLAGRGRASKPSFDSAPVDHRAGKRRRIAPNLTSRNEGDAA